MASGESTGSKVRPLFAGVAKDAVELRQVHLIGDGDLADRHWTRMVYNFLYNQALEGVLFDHHSRLRSPHPRLPDTLGDEQRRRPHQQQHEPVLPHGIPQHKYESVQASLMTQPSVTPAVEH